MPTFDLNFAKLMGECMGSASASGRNLNYDALLTGLVVGSINTPTYLAVPVQDAGVVDQFLADLDKEFARTAREKGGQSWWSLSQDFYRINEPNGRSTRCVSFAFTAVKWRAFWERIGNTLYVSSRKSVLDDLWNLNEKLAKGGEAAADITAPTEVKAHAMLRVRPQNWNEILADYRLGWAENNRLACLKNLGPISNAARGMELPAGPWAKGDAERLGSRAQLEANRLYTVYYFCPEGGHYLLNENGKDVACSVHGSALHPTQAMAPDENRSMGKLMQSFAGMTAALTFMEDGLHAVVTLDRK
ncbi:MAG: hypothetical protein HY291_02765 [Planctomycetes bacterium]|nr:hypothetical protein [Planctomycetota bacterium]